MDPSLSAIFSTLNPCHRHSPEAFQYKLMCASMEVQKIKAEAMLQESKLWRLQELLSMATKERDDARDECKRLQECILLQNTPIAMGMDSPSTFIHSSSIVSSPSSSTWSLQELEEHLNSDDFCMSVSAPAPFEIQQALESFSQSWDVDDGHLQCLFPDIKPAIMPCFEAPPCFNVSELQADAVAGVAPSSVRSLSRQSSSNSSSASAPRFHQGQASMESSGDNVMSVAKDASPASSMVAKSSAGKDGSSKAPSAKDSPPVMLSMPVLNAMPATSPTLATPTPSVGSNGACLARTASINTQFSRASEPYPALKAMSGPKVSLSAVPEAMVVANSQNGTTIPIRQVHLPEPPEADPQVMLNSLPEKGKLLQAVMQAGPLLQTLLLAGPLPQWRHPPPALRTGDIPKVPLAHQTVVSPYPTHMPPAAVQEPKVSSHHIKSSVTKTSRRRSADTESCGQSKKLRKLSPVLTKEARSMQVE